VSLLNQRWAQAAAELDEGGEAYVIATLVAAAGSTPRASGSKMVIGREHTYASIGGGQLEFLVIQRARELLLANSATQEIRPFPLAAEAQQCCGGSVTVLFEAFPAAALSVAVFGAGHVAQALLPILAGLDCRLQWIDSRSDLLQTPLARQVQRRCLPDPESAIDDLPLGAWALILTHDHALDYRLVRRLLSGGWRRVGLIGSATKAERFRARLARDGLSKQQIECLRCPVGLPGLRGKLPMEVAIAIAAQLLSEQPLPGSRPGALDWRSLRGLLEAPAP